MRILCLFWTALILSITSVSAFSQETQSTSGESRDVVGSIPTSTTLLLIASEVESNLLKQASNEMEIYQLTNLPNAEDAKEAISLSVITSKPFVELDGKGDVLLPRGDTLLVSVSGRLAQQDKEIGFQIGGTDISHDKVAPYLNEIFETLPAKQKVIFIDLLDEDSLAYSALATLQKTVVELNADLGLISIKKGDAAACQSERGALLPLYFRSGVADTLLSGNKDGLVTLGEAQTFIGDFLQRSIQRQPDCQFSNLMLKGQQDEDAPLMAVKPNQGLDFVEDLLGTERLRAQVLIMSPERAAMQSFLNQCELCPQAAQFQLFLEEDAPGQQSGLEDQLWQDVQANGTKQAYELYLENCKACTFEDQARANLEDMDEEVQQRRKEEAYFTQARDNRNSTDLQDYLSTCVQCEHVEEAKLLIEQLKIEAAIEEESGKAQSILASPNFADARSYLESCQHCPLKTEVETLLSNEDLLKEVRESCTKLAGMPQQGGPRLLMDIDHLEARKVCEKALGDFPNDPWLVVLLGRVDQAANRLGKATEAYDFGVENEISFAYGLAAYAKFLENPGNSDNISIAHELAQKGKEAGDWLSRELLVTLYSRQLIDGKGLEDAAKEASILASQSNPLGHFYMGYFRLTGQGLTKSEEAARSEFEKAVKLKYLNAYPFLADIYEQDPEAVDQAGPLYWEALQGQNSQALIKMTTQLRERKQPVIAFVQDQLKEIGMYNGLVDGIAGAGTESAIQKFVDSLKADG